MSTEDLEARRWFRQRLAWLGRQYPHLQQPASQDRLTAELDRQEEEEAPHGLHTDRKTRRTAQDEGLQVDLTQDAPGTP